MPAIIDENTQYIDPDTSAPIVNGKVFYGAQGSDPEAVPIKVFSNRAMTDPGNVVAQPVRTDASGRTIPSPLFAAERYSFRVKLSDNTEKLINLDAGQPAEAVGISKLTNIGGTGNAITADADPPISSLGPTDDGRQFTLTTLSINTDKMTLAIGAIPAKPIRFNFKEEMAPGFVQATATVNITYNSAEDAFMWNNEGRGISLLTGIAGDGNDITATGGSPSVTGYVNGQIYQWEQNITNTLAVTLKVAALPKLSIKSQGAEIPVGVLKTNVIYFAAYNATGTLFELVSGVGNVVGPSSAVADNLTSYNGTTGLLIEDSGIAKSDVVLKSDTTFVTATKTDIQNIATGVAIFSAISGLTATITPKTTSHKVRVWGFINAAADSINETVALRLMRDSTPIGIGDADGTRTRCTSAGNNTDDQSISGIPFDFTDTPNTASSINYTVQGAAIGGANGNFGVNKPITATDNTATLRCISTINAQLIL